VAAAESAREFPRNWPHVRDLGEFGLWANTLERSGNWNAEIALGAAMSLAEMRDANPDLARLYDEQRAGSGMTPELRAMM